MGAERDVWAGIRFTFKWTSVSPAATPIYHLFTPRPARSSAETSDPSGRRLKSLSSIVIIFVLIPRHVLTKKL
ncbi:hypothetical protein H9L39_01697 [Fusarium oxysporum f. sp. albedinis]|nr:hypothetical protein H9L39_01697 [Fusarium oxysporum f. sp. albedinis]